MVTGFQIWYPMQFLLFSIQFCFLFHLSSYWVPSLIWNSQGMHDKPNITKITSHKWDIIGIHMRSCVSTGTWDTIWSTYIDQFSCEWKKLKDLKKQLWSVLCFFTIIGKVARISCGVRFWLNFFAVLQFRMIFLLVVRFPIDPNFPSLGWFLRKKKLPKDFCQTLLKCPLPMSVSTTALKSHHCIGSIRVWWLGCQN